MFVLVVDLLKTIPKMLAPNIYSNSLAHSSKTIFHKTLFVDAKLNKAQHTRSERKSTIKQTQDNVKTLSK